MVDEVVRFTGIGRNERDAHGIGQCLDISDRCRQADVLRVEVAQVLLELLRCVAVRVDADQHYPHALDCLFGQLGPDLLDLRQGRGADVRAEGVAEEHQRPLVFQAIKGHGRAVLVGHAQGRQLAAFGEQDNTGVVERRLIL